MPGTEFSLSLDWHSFDTAAAVEDVPIEVQQNTVIDASFGTTIEIKALRIGLAEVDVKKMARAIVLLADPFDNPTGFKPVLKVPQFKEVERRVATGYFDQADFHLVAKLNGEGQASAQVLDFKGDLLFEGDHNAIAKKSEKYDAPELEFELWSFRMEKNNFSTRSISFEEVKEWISTVGGVHLYHRGLRVKPYGDPGHDWLDMNLSRVRSPEHRPSTNNSIGKISLSDPEEKLLQKTDRSGFIESEQFHQLKKFSQDVLDWMARKRLDDREKKRTKQKDESSKKVLKAKELVVGALSKVPKTKQRKEAEKAFSSFLKELSREKKLLKDDIQLYRTLGTVGTTSAAFAHETRAPLSKMIGNAKALERRAKEFFPLQYESSLREPMEIILKSAEAINSFSKLTLNLLAREKRRQGRVDIHEVIEGVFKQFRPFLETQQIEDEQKLCPGTPYVFSSIAALESILANLLTNSINALRKRSGEKKIRIQTNFTEFGLAILHSDNGPGIKGIDVNEIWLPGQTTTPGGTGLGLTIVRDSVNELGGKVSALQKGKMGGAELLIEFPLVGR
jgi:nitrogen-specific signal transduction histidine kinase